jgi:aromatic ring hydroxylase
MTVHSQLIGEEINRFAHLPRNPYDLMQKQKMIRLAVRRVGGCLHRCMGHDAINALAICTKEIDEAKGTDYHGRFLAYLKEYQRNDWDGCCAQTDSKGDRMKRPSEQPNPDAYVHVVEERKDGIVVSGVKMSITQVAYADEMFVLPTRALMEDDRAFAVAFVLPADWEGVHLITRPVWHRERTTPGASPFCRYGVSIRSWSSYNVFVPKQRVFMCGEWSSAGASPFCSRYSHRHSYSGCKPGVSDILCGTTALAAEANNIQKEPTFAKSSPSSPGPPSWPTRRGWRLPSTARRPRAASSSPTGCTPTWDAG